MINRLVELVLVEVMFSGGRLGTKHEKKMKNAIKIVERFSQKSLVSFSFTLLHLNFSTLRQHLK